MSRLKKKIKTVVAALIVIGIAFTAHSQDNSEIDIDKLERNPFVSFVGEKQTPLVEVGELQSELFVETISLKFLDPRSLQISLTNMSGAYGSIEPDGRSNSLIICDTKENLAKIIEQIRKIDRKPKQVMIEVVILDVRLDDETEIGINWDMLTTEYNGRFDNDSKIGTSFRQNLGFTNRVGSTEATTTNVGNATAWNTTGTGSAFSIITGDIRNVIRALQQKNNVEILASPRVMVVSGQTASIEAVEEIPYQERTETSEGGELTSVQFKNVGIMLNVGATLTDDNFIHLDVETEQNSYTGELSSVPVVDTRKIKSSLLLNDGQILVIGGLRRKETQKQTNQIPILGDIPIIGLAFKTTDTIQNNSELLVILSPHIYKGERPNNVEMEKFNEITQRPLLTIPEVVEKKKEEEKQKAREAKKAKKAKKQRK